jgi:hypothetical protein
MGSKEVSSGIWWRPQAALGILNTLFANMHFHHHRNQPKSR